MKINIIDGFEPKSKWYKRALHMVKGKILFVWHMITKQCYVGFTPAFQSYFSAGDEAEPYCTNCEKGYIEDDFKYCPECGRKLIWPD